MDSSAKVLRVSLVVLVAVVAAGCHGAASSASRPTPPASGAAACRTDQLSAVFRAVDGSTGHYHGVLVLENTGAARCALFATVRLQMVAADGGPLETTTTVDTSTGRPGPVVLAPSSRGSIQVTWVEISSGEPCVTPASLQVIPPTDPHPLVVPWPAGHDLVCGHGVITTRPARADTPSV